jgi:eukaryotic-like serine/threonine-protein kinase
VPEIQLTRTWTYGDELGGGGFGRVYRAICGDEQAALKLVPKAPGAEREMLFVDLAEAQNVVPIIDSGETKDAWALVMPLAERTLREELDTAGTLTLADARNIAIDVLVALASLDGRVVHRDLKPENVLRLDGTWCLADFGISRYAEATTSQDTQKYAMSAPYAAPERWRAERATSATDIYSFGVMLYELLVGELPFPGPDYADFRDQHLHHDPPEPDGAPDSLAALLRECMYRSPNARPRAANALERLRRIAPGRESGGLADLEAANRATVAERSQRDRAESQARSEAEAREALAQDARTALDHIGERLRSTIADAAPAVSVDVPRPTNWTLALGDAEFSLTGPMSIAREAVEQFDVVLSATIGLQIPPNHDGFQGCAHSLWFCDAQVEGEYRWFEVAFKVMALVPERATMEPFALDPESEEVGQALFSGLGTREVAWPFTLLEADDLSEFLDRWAGWFAQAATGSLARELNAAPGANYSWRRN